MKEIIKKSGDVFVKLIESNGAASMVSGKSEFYNKSVFITPVTATLMIQALQEYLDGLSVSQPVDYVKPIAE